MYGCLGFIWKALAVCCVMAAAAHSFSIPSTPILISTPLTPICRRGSKVLRHATAGRDDVDLEVANRNMEGEIEQLRAEVAELEKDNLIIAQQDREVALREPAIEPAPSPARPAISDVELAPSIFSNITLAEVQSFLFPKLGSTLTQEELSFFGAMVRERVRKTERGCVRQFPNCDRLSCQLHAIGPLPTP